MIRHSLGIAAHARDARVRRRSTEQLAREIDARLAEIAHLARRPADAPAPRSTGPVAVAVAVDDPYEALRELLASFDERDAVQYALAGMSVFRQLEAGLLEVARSRGIAAAAAAVDVGVDNAGPRPPPALTQREIDRRYPAMNVLEKQQCAICQETMRGTCRELCCQHAFCPPCIDRWLRVNATCPLCKASQV